MKTFDDCPFPTAWTAEELTDAMPRRLSTLFASGIPVADAPGRRGGSARVRGLRPERGLPTLFRVH